jgi:hypothetical protein
MTLPNWLPLVLKGKRIEASFVYKDDNETVGEAEIEEWDDNEQGRLVSPH